MNYQRLKTKVEEYYSQKLSKYGAKPQGVDWKDRRSQDLRFTILLELIKDAKKFSLNDLGCGYGALWKYLQIRHHRCQYIGYDISPVMIKAATSIFPWSKNCKFVCSDQLQLADYTVSSGLFNVKLDVPSDTWLDYILYNLKLMDRASRKGFAFNLLTSFSDPSRRRKDLYYADPGFFFKYCKTRFAKKVALLHGYDLYEFTILVKK